MGGGDWVWGGGGVEIFEEWGEMRGGDWGEGWGEQRF